MNRTLSLSVLSSLIFLTSSAFAQDEAPAEQLAAIQRLVGNWQFRGNVTMGSEVESLTGTLACESVSAGYGALCRATFLDSTGAVEEESVNLFGYDPGDGLVHWYAVTNHGETHDHAGGFTGNTLALLHTGPMNGQTFEERITMTIDDDRLSGSSTVQVGLDTMVAFTFEATR